MHPRPVPQFAMTKGPTDGARLRSARFLHEAHLNPPLSRGERENADRYASSIRSMARRAGAATSSGTATG
jgi:hypothetical protein